MKRENIRVSTPSVSSHGVDCWQEDSFVPIEQDGGFGDWASSSFGEDFFPDEKITKPSNKSSSKAVTATSRASTRTSSTNNRRSKSSNNRHSRHKSNSNSKDVEVNIDPPTPPIDTKIKDQRDGRRTNDNIDAPTLNEEKHSDIP